MKTLTSLVLTILTTCTFAQQANQTDEKEHQFSFSFDFGNYTQQLEQNDNHLTNEPSYSAGLLAEYRLSEDYSLKTGFYQIDKISFSGLTYDAYKIPLLLSSNIYFNSKLKDPNTRLIVTLGGYFRTVNDFTNNSNMDYDTNSVFGFHASFGIQHDITDRLFAQISVQRDRDFSDLLESANSNIRIESSYGLFLGFGYRL